MEPNPHILKRHHITLSVGTAQEDYDFHTEVLGLKSVKKPRCMTATNLSITFTTEMIWATKAR
jgi:catechol-2,3-dioxygenase